MVDCSRAIHKVSTTSRLGLAHLVSPVSCASWRADPSVARLDRRTTLSATRRVRRVANALGSVVPRIRRPRLARSRRGRTASDMVWRNTLHPRRSHLRRSTHRRMQPRMCSGSRRHCSPGHWDQRTSLPTHSMRSHHRSHIAARMRNNRRSRTCIAACCCHSTMHRTA